MQRLLPAAPSWSLNTEERAPWENLGYFAVAVRHSGVPEMWVHDAVQDVALRVWRAPHMHWKAVVQRAAVDAGRRYGQDQRVLDKPPPLIYLGRIAPKRPTSTAETGPIMRDVPAPDPYPAIDTILSLPQAWRTLSPNQRRAIREKMDGRRPHDGWSKARDTQASLGRKRLRRHLSGV